MKIYIKHLVLLVLVCLLWSPVATTATVADEENETYERDDEGENEVEIRPEYDESNENNYLADQDV